MIVESKAIEPKAGSATSVYPAIIVNINDPAAITTNTGFFMLLLPPIFYLSKRRFLIRFVAYS